jgi:hypothetical protein
MWSEPAGSCRYGAHRLHTTATSRGRDRDLAERFAAHYLVEVIPAGKDAWRLAEKARTRMLGEVDKRRNPRTKATVIQLQERYLGLLQIEDTTRAGYERLVRLHIGPTLGALHTEEDSRPRGAPEIGAVLSDTDAGTIS